jgi:hypothetical protein
LNLVDNELYHLSIEKPSKLNTVGTLISEIQENHIRKRWRTHSSILKNEVQVPAMARFDAIRHEFFKFLGNMSLATT